MKSLIRALWYVGIGIVVAYSTACTEKKSTSLPLAEVKIDTLVKLRAEDISSPALHFKMDYQYVAEQGEQDTVAQKINLRIREYITSDEAVHQQKGKEFVHAYLLSEVQSYREDNEPFYESSHELEQLLDFEKQVLVTIKMGKEDVLICEIVVQDFSGGAHANSYTSLLCFDTRTGEQLVYSNVFIEGSEGALTELISEALIPIANERLQTDTIQTAEQMYQALYTEGIFISQNFSLEEDGIRFYYNTYDIAPYAFGTFDIKLPYNKVEYLMYKR